MASRRFSHCSGCDYQIGKGHEEGCPQAPAARRRRAELDAAQTIWVCEKGHVDDHHLTYPNPGDLCSRCGGKCEAFKSLDALARALVDARSIQQDKPTVPVDQGGDASARFNDAQWECDRSTDVAGAGVAQSDPGPVNAPVNNSGQDPELVNKSAEKLNSPVPVEGDGGLEAFEGEWHYTFVARDLEHADAQWDKLDRYAESLGFNGEGGHVHKLDADDLIPGSPTQQQLEQQSTPGRGEQ